MKAFKHLIGFLAEAARLVLLFYWLQILPEVWSSGPEFNLFFLFIISPQMILPLLWLLGIKQPLPQPYIQLGISVRWTVLVVDLAAGAWHLFAQGLEFSPGRPEFLLTLLIGLADITIITLLKGKNPDSAGAPE